MKSQCCVRKVEKKVKSVHVTSITHMKKMMENICEDELSVKEMELMEPNYEVFMRWAQPTTIWDTISNRIRMASIR